MPTIRQISRPTGLLGLVVAASIFAAAAAPAHAQKLELLDLELVKPPEDDKKAKPVYRAVIDYSVLGVEKEKFVLKDMDVEPPVQAEAESVKTFPESKDKLTLVVLVQGSEAWMGTEAAADIKGGFVGLGDALTELTKAGPEGSSRGALLVYRGTSVEEKYALGDITGLPASIGTQQDYIAREDSDRGVPFLVGLDAAYRKMAEGKGRRVLVVIGDGSDDELDGLGNAVNDKLKRFKALGAEVFSIFYAPLIDVGKQNMNTLGYSGFYAPTSPDAFKSNAADIVARLAARYYVDFPAEPFATEKETVRELTVLVDDNEAEPKEMATVKLYVPPPESSLWWLWLLIILVVLIVIIVVVVKLKNRAPPPPVMEMPEEAPAAPAGPAKTVMLGIGGNDEGFPIVGWVVPLTGPNQYQTFKLHQGQTVLGNGGEAHVVINDNFMSGQHAEIACTPVGFVLKDLGSTNGTLVNERRVDTHELFDNDVFTLGKTNFKFKSIN